MSADYIPPGTRLYLTPNSVPVGRFCRVINIPDDPVWIGLVDGVLSALFDPARWRQFGALTTEEAASAWQTMVLESWGEHCMECLDVMSCFSTYTPALGVTYGLDNNGNPEQSFDGGTTWFPVTDTGATTQLPALTSTPGVDNDAKKCLAAQRAVNSLNALFIQASAALAAGKWGDNTEAIQGLYQVLNIVLSEFKPIFELISLFITHWVGDLLTAFAETGLTSGEQDALLCLLYDNATVSASGVVTFDYMYIFNHIDDALTIASSIGMSYYLLTIGADGLNRAGNVNNASTADCAGCNEPVCADYENNFNTGFQGATTGGLGGWIAAWDSVQGHSAPGSLYNTQDQGDGSKWGSVTVDLGLECQLTTIAFWLKIQHTGSAAYQVKQWNADQQLVGDSGLIGAAGANDLAWHQYARAGAAGVRYVSVAWICNSQAIKIWLDDLTIDVT